MTKQQIVDLISVIQDNIDNIVLQSPSIMDGLEANGYSMKNLGDAYMISKVTTPRSEAMQSTDATVLATYDYNEELIIVGAVDSPIKAVLVGKGDTEENSTLKVLATIFGYTLTDSDIQAEPEFWDNASTGIFNSSVGILNEQGNFYLSYEACQRAYDIFASLGQGGDDVTVYYNEDDVELPVAFYGDGEGVFFTNDSSRVQQMGYKKQIITYPGVNGIQYGANIYKIDEFSYDTYWACGIFLEESRWQESSITIPLQVEYTYLDDTTYTYTVPVVLSPALNGPPTDDHIVTLGGTRYWWIENSFYLPSGSATSEVYPTPYYMPPTQVGQNWYTDFITQLNGFVSHYSSGGGGGITLPEIPGSTHPTLGGTFETTYPTEYADNTTDGEYVYVFIDTTGFSASWWNKWYEDSNDEAERVRDGDNPDNPGGYDEGEGHSPELPDDDGNNTGFTACYHPSKAIVNGFNEWLWGSVFDLSTFKKLFQDPMEAIISLHKIYVTPTNATNPTTIHLGRIDTGISCPYCDDTHIQLSCGSIKIPEFFKNAMDYNNNTRVSIFLPFIGFQELSPKDVIDKTLTVTYNIDIVSGACLADIRVSKGAYSCSIAQFGGNCSVEIPTSSVGHKNILGNLTALAISVGAAIATEGAAIPVLGAIGAGANTALNSQANVSRGGTIGANIGELSIKKPFVIVKRQYNSTPYRYQDISGYPSASNVALRNCAGYTRVKEIHLDAVQATQREKEELERLLKEGVEI